MGPSCFIFARRPVTEGILLDIDGYLTGVADRVERTRKGRVWQVWISARPFGVEIKETEAFLSFCEDDLLKVGLLPDEAPFTIVLNAGLKQADDYEILRRVSDDLSPIVSGLATEPMK